MQNKTKVKEAKNIFCKPLYGFCPLVPFIPETDGEDKKTHCSEEAYESDMHTYLF